MSLSVSRSFKVYLDGSSYRLVDLRNATMLSRNSDAATVLNQAATSVNAAGALYMMPATYLLGSKWNGLIDKNMRIVGERSAATGSVGQSGDVIIKANYTNATDALIDCTNTTYSKQQFENIVVDCNDTVGLGIKVYDGRERNPLFRDVQVFNATDIGVSLEKTWYTTAYNLVVSECLNTGLLLKGTTAGEACNTLYFYGGRISSNGRNVDGTGTVVDVGFNNTVLEQNNTTMAFTNSVRIPTTGYGWKFTGCSFEYLGAVDKEIIEDNGNNNTFDGNRFDATNTLYTAYRAKSTCKNSKVINNLLQANTASTTARMIIDSGATGIKILDNQQATSTPLKVLLLDSGTGTITLGNSFGFDSFLRSTRSGGTGAGKRTGHIFQGGNLQRLGLCGGWTAVGTPSTGTFTASENARPIRYTTAGAAGDNAGENCGTALTCRQWYPVLSSRFRINDVTNTRLYIGIQATGTSPSSDDPLNAQMGIHFGKITTDTSWVVLHNDAAGATVVDDTAILADTNIHNVQIIADHDNSQFIVILDGANLFQVSTDIPGAGNSMQPMVQIEAVDAAARTLDIFNIELESF